MIAAGAVIVALALVWCIYYAVYSQVKGGNSLATKINMLLGSSGDPIPVQGDGRKKDVATVLIGGKDGTDLDTLLLGVLDQSKGELNLLVIPRDTLSDCDRNNKKISKAYEAGGMEELKKELRLLTGLPVDRYVLLDYQGLSRLVDQVGGVQIAVSQAMEDELHNIHIPAGEQTLDGANALGYLRYLGYSDGDQGRIRAQQVFLKAFAKSLTAQAGTVSPKKLAAEAAECVETDLSAGELLRLTKTAMQADVQKALSWEVLPGLSADFLKTTYYIVNETAALGMLNSRYNPYQEPIKSLFLSSVGQNLFEGGKWSGSIGGSEAMTPPEDSVFTDPTRFCEYYYEYGDGIADSLFADAMDTPDKTKEKPGAQPSPASTPRPVETLTIPKIQPTPTPEPKDRFIVLDPDQKPEDYGIDPDKVEYLTPSPTPTPTPEPEPGQPVEVTPEPAA